MHKRDCAGKDDPVFCSFSVDLDHSEAAAAAAAAAATVKFFRDDGSEFPGKLTDIYYCVFLFNFCDQSSMHFVKLLFSRAKTVF